MIAPLSHVVRLRRSFPTALVPLALVTFLAAALRLYISPRIGLWYDEACTLFLSEYVSNPTHLFNPDYNIDPPLFLIIAWFWRHFLDFFSVVPGTYLYDYLLRLPPIFFSILTVPTVYFAGRSLLAGSPTPSNLGPANGVTPEENKALFFAALLVAISPLQLYYAHELRSYSLFALLGTACLWLFTKALRDNKTSSWALLTLCLVLAFWNHFFAAWFFLCIDVYMLITWSTSRKCYRTWAFWHIVAGLACLPPLYNVYHTSEIVSHITGQWIPAPDVKSLFITFKAFFAGYSPRSWAYWPVFILASLLFCLGVWQLCGKRRALLLLLLWTGLPMIFAFLFWSTQEFSYYEIRLFIASSITASLLVGFGWTHLPRLLRIAAALAVLCFTAPLLADTYNQHFHPLPQHRLGVRHKADNRAAANYIALKGRPGESVFHLSHVTLPSFRVYLNGFPQTHICLGDEQVEGFIGALPNLPLWQHLDMVPVPLYDLDLSMPSFWLIISWWEPFNRPADLTEVERRLKEQFVEIDRHEFFAVSVLHFEKLSSKNKGIEISSAP